MVQLPKTAVKEITVVLDISSFFSGSYLVPLTFLFWQKLSLPMFYVFITFLIEIQSLLLGSFPPKLNNS